MVCDAGLALHARPAATSRERSKGSVCCCVRRQDILCRKAVWTGPQGHLPLLAHGSYRYQDDLLSVLTVKNAILIVELAGLCLPAGSVRLAAAVGDAQENKANALLRSHWRVRAARPSEPLTLAVCVDS